VHVGTSPLGATARPGSTDPPDQVDAHVSRRPRPDDEAFYRYLAPGLRWMDYKLSVSPTLSALEGLLSDSSPLRPGMLPGTSAPRRARALAAKNQ